MADFQDLLKLLRDRPDWREELRRLLLTDDLLGLPRALQQLAETVQQVLDLQAKTQGQLDRVEQAVARLAQAQVRTEEAVAQLAQAQARTEERVGRLEEAVAQLAQAQARTEERVGRLEEAVAQLAQAQARTEERVGHLEEAVAQLAQAQARTEERVGHLEEAVAQLAQAQARTEERVGRLEEAVAQLAQAQARTEERVGRLEEAVAQLAQAQAATERAVQQLAQQVGRLSDAVGFTLEELARELAPSYLAERYGIRVPRLERRFVTVDGEEVEFDLFGEGTRDGERVVVLGEVRSRIYGRDVEVLARRARSLAPQLPGTPVPALFGFAIHPSASEAAARTGVLVIAAVRP